MNPSYPLKSAASALLATGLLTSWFLNPVIAAVGDEWINLFDGKTLQGWTRRGDVEMEVAQGEIRLRAKSAGWAVAKTRASDFVFEVDAKLPAGDHANSGIAFRGEGETGKPRGYQCEIDPSQRAWTGGLHVIGDGWIPPINTDEQSLEAFLKQSQGSFKQHDWNRFRIHCEKDRIRIYVNSVLTTDVRDNRYQAGFFALQHHGGEGTYRFRRIRYRPLPASTINGSVVPLGTSSDDNR